jgi:N-terminal domain of (some) glycogen debranching enzymes
VSEGGPIETLGLEIGRHINGELHEDIEITNNSQNPVRFNLEIAIRADFADIFEVKSNHVVRRGRITINQYISKCTSLTQGNEYDSRES